MSNRTILVTGGSGFLGRRVIPRLVSMGADVVALARSQSAAKTVSDLGARPISGDLDDFPSTSEAFSESDASALINLASLGFGHAPSIVKAAEAAQIKRAIFVSTTAIFTTLEASSKTVRLAAEDTVSSSSLDWTIIRPTMIYGGPDDRNMARLLRLLRRIPIMPIPGSGEHLHQPIHVDDLADVIVATIDRPASIRKAYNVAGPDPISFRDVVIQAGDAVGRRPLLIRIPLTPTLAMLRLYERHTKNPRLKAEQLERLTEDKAFDITDAISELDLSPRPFTRGIAEEARELN